MKTLIINGSPRKSGDTAALIEILKENLNGEVHEVSAYRGNFKPCIDCRSCWKTKGCAIKDDMAIICDDSFDAIIIASPIYNYNLPAPMINIDNRFNYLYANKRFAGILNERKEKAGAIILVGGGDGEPIYALPTAKTILNRINAKIPEQHIITYLNTDAGSAIKDMETVQKIKLLAKNLNELYKH